MRDTLISLGVIAVVLGLIIIGVAYEAVKFLAWWHIAFGGHHG